MSFAVTILAGGESRRMGQDKAHLLVNGTPLIELVAQAVTPLTPSEILIVGGDPDLVELTSTPSRHIADSYPGEGPLGGIISGLSTLKRRGCQHVLTLACDLPALEARALHHLHKEAVATDADVCIPLCEGRRQWHVAVWNTRSLSPLLDSFSSGNRAVWRGAEQLRQTLTISADTRQIVDLDSPRDVVDFGELRFQRPRPGVEVYDRPVQIPEISVDTLAQLAESDTHVNIVDVREPHEYEAAHASRAILIPLGDVVARKDELPDGPLHIICGSGVRSMHACEALAPLGFDVTNVAGGTGAWVEAGHPTTAGSSPE